MEKGIKGTVKKVIKKGKGFVKKLTKKFKGIDVLDGRKRTEKILRRLLILLLVVLVLVLSFLLLKSKNVKNICENEKVEEVVETENIETGKKEVTVAVADIEEIVVQEVKRDRVKEYIVSYGGRINDEYLNTLRKYCDEDTLKLVVAISVAETNMGKATDNHSNFYGYFYKGNRGYDPSYEEMSRVICNGVSKYYSDVATNRSRAVKYTGNDNVDRWIKTVNGALSKME